MALDMLKVRGHGMVDDVPKSSIFKYNNFNFIIFSCIICPSESSPFFCARLEQARHFQAHWSSRVAILFAMAPGKAPTESLLVKPP